MLKFSFIIFNKNPYYKIYIFYNRGILFISFTKY
nr:MAG TPA: hypothetical protein [Caudoviricetes sp.]